MAVDNNELAGLIIHLGVVRTVAADIIDTLQHTEAGREILDEDQALVALPSVLTRYADLLRRYLDPQVAKALAKEIPDLLAGTRPN